jgi:hypothetical protein
VTVVLFKKLAEDFGVTHIRSGCLWLLDLSEYI